ncbi:hypothetical protein [Bacteroides oleiciplenus]|uniref:Uncharacterized protein n=1 Tax=Bacteroides oleiciplenus TaxID=626931 RepID=A0A3E5B936_9BACE|nr:hypothetical protein [Bacteroides oleiciplenus]RGN33835.1 hypothetical protein DXB65_15250 [Bacteroides oleiciplenus]
MKEIKLIPQAPMTIIGPDLEELRTEAKKYIDGLRKAGKNVAYTTMYAAMVIPVELDAADVKTGGKRKAVIANDVITL